MSGFIYYITSQTSRHNAEQTFEEEEEEEDLFVFNDTIDGPGENVDILKSQCPGIFTI